MAIQAFTVLSEFKFDVAHAVVGSETLQTKIDGISNAANNAQKSMFGMGVGLISSFSGAQAGIFGVIGNAISASDKFKATQIEIGNAMVANSMTMNGEVVAFNQSLTKSGQIIDGIVAKSRDFGIDPNEFTNQTKFYTNLLAPKGLAGDDLSNATELARVSMKAAPALGVSGDQATSGIMSGISGDLSKQTQFGTRLFMEAGDAIFKATGIKDLKQFNVSKPELRVKALIVGLDKLAGTMDTVHARADTFSNRLATLKNLFTGVGSVLKPLGDVFIPFINKLLDVAIGFIKGKGAKLITMFGGFMEDFLKTPEELFVDLKQGQALAGNFKFAAWFGGMWEIMHLLMKIPFIGAIASGIAGKAFGLLGGALSMLGKALIFLWPLINVMVGAMLTFAAVTTVLTAAFQGIERAIARMEIETIVWLADNSVRLAEIMGSLKDSFLRFMQPLADITNGFEYLFYSIFGGTYVLDAAADAAAWLADAMVNLSGGFSIIYSTFRALLAGMFDVIFRFVENIGTIMANLSGGNVLNPLEGTKNIFGGYMQAFDDEFEGSMKRAMNPNESEGVNNNKVSNHNHNYDVKMTNNFKEVLQPDRIAYTIVDQLKKASTNRTGGKTASGTAGRLAEAT